MLTPGCAVQYIRTDVPDHWSLDGRIHLNTHGVIARVAVFSVWSLRAHMTYDRLMSYGILLFDSKEGSRNTEAEWRWGPGQTVSQ